MKQVYDFRDDPAPIELVETARRDILDPDQYSYGGVRMVDLVHASRGCRFDCYPCSVGVLGGRVFRPRPVEKVIEELESIENPRLFIVDNTLAQDREWALDLFRAMEPLGKRWICHPLPDDEDVVESAARAGCWYVYQAIVDTSDHIRTRIQRLRDRDIGVEGTVLLGWPGQTEDDIRELVQFLIEIDLDMAEFTILTPFPGSRAREELEAQERILSNDWNEYTTDRVVFQPETMTLDRLQELHDWAWETFYADEPQRLKMYRLLKKVL